MSSANMHQQRQSSPTRADYAELSSPDPLADSSMEDVVRSTYNTRRRSSAASASSRKQTTNTRSSKIHEIELSPTKMVTEQNLSPWRIKVTVEAEPEDGYDLATDLAATGRTHVMTKTMKIPLRDESSPTRNSSNTSIVITKKKKEAAARRSASPAPPSTRTSRSRRQSVTDLDIVVLGDDADEDEWGVKPRSPRKPRRNSKSTTGLTGKRAASSPVKRRSGSTAADFHIQEDQEDQEVANTVPDGQVQCEENSLPELRDIDLNRVSNRAQVDLLVNDNGQKKRGQEQNVRKISINSAMSYPTPSPTASNHGNSDQHEPDDAYEDGPEIGLETVMESEGFTMIDLDSLPSVKLMRNTPDNPTITEEEDNTQNNVSERSTTEVSNLEQEAPSIAITEEVDESSEVSTNLPSSPPESTRGTKSKTYSIGHLQLPSSTHIQRHRLVTPMPMNGNPFSSPQLPSPPKAPASTVKERSPIHSEDAVQAGSILQGAVVPKHDFSHERRVSEEDALFEGFSSSTRRELRAELRFGEELGKKNLQKQQVTPGERQLQVTPPAENTYQQVWRGETTVLHTPPVVEVVRKSLLHPVLDKDRQLEHINDVFEVSRLQMEKERRQEREAVIEQAKNDEAIVIDDDDSDDRADGETVLDPDETMGDIWLDEARQKSSSPRETTYQASVQQNPRRKLIPSPWKRGQQLEASQVTNDESFSGLLWKELASDGSNDRFGDAIVANPNKAKRKSNKFDRRRSGEYDAEHMMMKQTQRLNEREDSDDQDIEDQNFNVVRGNLRWRSAADVIEEETAILETEHKLNALHTCGADQVGGTTHLYETNLEDVPEQDLSSSPQLPLAKRQIDTETEHDSTYSSISADSSSQVYRQRTSISPSKDRPNTPRSALKGGRASFGMALSFGPDESDEAYRKRVVWAKRSSCMNERWEESESTIRSSQPEESITPVPEEGPRESQGLILEASFEVNPQPPQQVIPKKGWFGWFAKDEVITTQDPGDEPKNPGSQATHSLDGSIDTFIKEDPEDQHSDSSYAPTSRHTSVQIPSIQLRFQKQSENIQSNLAEKAETGLDGNLASPDATSSPSKIESYLCPASYPSDPQRDPCIPLSTIGDFTRSHFKTLNIIYAKSRRSRFHGPSYPDHIRPTILDLIGTWKYEVDESETMGEDGLFEFAIGEREARVLERFMREIEHDYNQVNENVHWGWSTAELAEKLGRIAVGEMVREEEKAADQILNSVRKVVYR